MGLRVCVCVRVSAYVHVRVCVCVCLSTTIKQSAGRRSQDTLLLSTPSKNRHKLILWHEMRDLDVSTSKAPSNCLQEEIASFFPFFFFYLFWEKNTNNYEEDSEAHAFKGP